MPKFTAHVPLHDESGKLHQFAPEDVAPAWVKSLVGNHVLDKPFGGKGSGRPSAAATTAGTKGEPDNEPSGDAENPADQDEADSGGEAGDELSFTGDNPVKDAK